MSQLDDITTKVTKLEGKVNSIETMSGKLDILLKTYRRVYIYQNNVGLYTKKKLIVVAKLMMNYFHK